MNGDNSINEYQIICKFPCMGSKWVFSCET